MRSPPSRWRETALLVATAALSQAALSPAARAHGPLHVPAVGGTEPIRSLRVTSPGAPVVEAPRATASRRGSLAREQRLPYMGEAHGTGCEGTWYRIEPEGYVCSRWVEPSTEPPDARPSPPEPATGEVLPWPYGYARVEGARVYRRAEDVEAELWDSELDPGFGVGVRRRVTVWGQRFYETLGGRLIPMRELRLAQPTRFHGTAVETADGLARVGWVIEREVQARATPGGARRTTLFSRLDRVDVHETVRHRGGEWLRVGETAWLPARSVRRPDPIAPPEGVGAEEPWVDVDRARQVLTMYVGDRPVYATLVSTGRPGTPTPPGIFRVWVKLARSLMDNVEDEDALRTYSLDDVPWVLYFDQGVALHAAFWHDRFGEPRSHGCVNLAPIDARAVFDRATPVLPAGWTAVFPTDRSPGMIVRVR